MINDGKVLEIVRTRVLPVAIPLIAIISVAALWRFTPLRDIVSQERLQGVMRGQWTKQWWTVLGIMAVYVVANAVMFPNSILNVAVILGVGGLSGWLFAISGSLSAATVFFWVGHFWGGERLQVWKYPGIGTIKTFLAKGGVAAVAAVHAVPSAPYGVVNSLIGTFDIRYRHFIIGTFLAHLPGTLSLAVFGTHLKTFVADPSPRNIAVFLLVAGGAVVLIVVLHRKMKAQIGDESEVNNSR